MFGVSACDAGGSVSIWILGFVEIAQTETVAFVNQDIIVVHVIRLDVFSLALVFLVDCFQFRLNALQRLLLVVVVGKRSFVYLATNLLRGLLVWNYSCCWDRSWLQRKWMLANVRVVLELSSCFWDWSLNIFVSVVASNAPWRVHVILLVSSSSYFDDHSHFLSIIIVQSFEIPLIETWVELPDLSFKVFLVLIKVFPLVAQINQTLSNRRGNPLENRWFLFVKVGCLVRNHHFRVWGLLKCMSFGNMVGNFKRRCRLVLTLIAILDIHFNRSKRNINFMALVFKSLVVFLISRWISALNYLGTPLWDAVKARE